MFKPNFTITSSILHNLREIDRLRIEIEGLPISPILLASLRKSARLRSTHYSTQIEGNRLSEQEVAQTIEKQAIIPVPDRDEKEVLGYYAAFEELEKLAMSKIVLVTEKDIQLLHGLVMGEGKKSAKPTPWRVDQNVVREGITRRIVYLPPEPKDVPGLMHDLVEWINKNMGYLAYPLIAGIAHYEFATIHPYLDGNGRTARLLTTLILHRSNYDLKGIYSLEEYYAKDLQGYYQAISIGPSHNYYEGRAQADITPWVEYFCAGMVNSFENVRKQAVKIAEKGGVDSSILLRKLGVRKRILLNLFQEYESVTTSQIAQILSLVPRTTRLVCAKWVEEGFLVIVNVGEKNRKYRLAPEYEALITQ